VRFIDLPLGVVPKPGNTRALGIAVVLVLRVHNQSVNYGWGDNPSQSGQLILCVVPDLERRVSEGVSPKWSR
jgi:hypothetical protein